MFKPKQKTLKQSLVGAVVKAVAFTAALGFGFIAVSTLVPTQVAMPEHGQAIEKPVAKGSPADLIAKHDCWTGEAPADMTGKMPGHVVVTKGVAPVYGGPRLVGQALEQIFEGKDHGFTVHGFCR